MKIFYENSKLGVWLAANHPEAKSFNRGLRETQVGEDESGEPIFEYGPEQFELIGWNDSWGTPPTEEEIEAFQPPPPEPNPLTDVEIAKREAKKNYLERREIRQANIDKLMVDVAFAMVAEGSFTVDNVDEEGSEFIAAHGGHIYRYVMGGNKTAQDLYDAIVASKNAEASARAFPWLSNAILAIFSKALLGR